MPCGSWPGHIGKSPRPPGVPTHGERNVESRDYALYEFPVGTEVGRQFVDAQGREKRFRGEVIDFNYPHWRVVYQGGDWEEFTTGELVHGIVQHRTHPDPPWFKDCRRRLVAGAVGLGGRDRLWVC